MRYLAQGDRQWTVFGEERTLFSPNFTEQHLIAFGILRNGLLWRRRLPAPRCSLSGTLVPSAFYWVLPVWLLLVCDRLKSAPRPHFIDSDGAPQIDRAASDPQINLIQMPRRVGLWASFAHVRCSRPTERFKHRQTEHPPEDRRVFLEATDAAQ
jgi:hypothetical protein